jgi:hypothetical protein
MFALSYRYIIATKRIRAVTRTNNRRNKRLLIVFIQPHFLIVVADAESRASALRTRISANRAMPTNTIIPFIESPFYIIHFFLGQRVARNPPSNPLIIIPDITKLPKFKNGTNCRRCDNIAARLGGKNINPMKIRMPHIKPRSKSDGGGTGGSSLMNFIS